MKKKINRKMKIKDEKQGKRNENGGGEEGEREKGEDSY